MCSIRSKVRVSRRCLCLQISDKKVETKKQFNYLQDGPSIESTYRLNVWMWLWDILVIGTLGPWDSWTSSLLQHLLMLPLTSSYPFFLLLPTSSYTLLTPSISSYLLQLSHTWFGLVWYGLVWGVWVLTLEIEIGDGLLTFILMLESCWWVVVVVCLWL